MDKSIALKAVHVMPTLLLQNRGNFWNWTKVSLREKCPYLELFWSVFSRIRTEYREIPVYLRIQSECGKIRTRITPNTDPFYAGSKSTNKTIITLWWRENWWTTITMWKVSKYGVFSGPYFPLFGLNTERYGVNLHIQSECGKIRTRKNSVFGHFHAVYMKVKLYKIAWKLLKTLQTLLGYLKNSKF